MENLSKLKGSAEFKNRILSKDEIKQITQSKGLLGISFINCPVQDDDILEISKLSKLVNVTLENTRITDRSLEYLAELPNLNYLFITQANVSGQGFEYFIGHKKLNCVWACHTQLNDETLKIVAQLPKLSILRIDATAVTFEGLMSIAGNPKIEIVANDLFSKEQLEQFEQEQRTLAKKKKSVNSQDITDASQKLLLFFKAMTEWEKYAAVHGFTNETSLRCKLLFQEYCTYKTRKGYRPDGLYYSNGPNHTYSTHKIVDSEQSTKNKIYLFTKDHIDFQYRFILVRNDDEWMVDDAQRLDGGWKKVGL